MSASDTDRNPPSIASLMRENSALRAENLRLRQQLASGAAEPRIEVKPETAGAEVARARPAGQPAVAGALDAPAKVALFASLFRVRPDLHALRWENSRTDRSGYSPACGNEWVRDVCKKPAIRCTDCPNQKFLPLDVAALLAHLRGQSVVGVYPLHLDESCRFLAVDFDASDWRDDVRALAATCTDHSVPHGVEISRSGNGAHLWVFFEEAVPARQARALGSALISETCRTRRSLKLSSYDRLFPSQDTLPRGGFGNLIALPLQRAVRHRGASQFVDPLTLEPPGDQWAFLAGIARMTATGIDVALARLTRRATDLDVAFAADEASETPWLRQAEPPARIPGKLPDRLSVTLADQLYVPRTNLPQPLANRIIRLAAFRNPEFQKAQAMRLPVWDKPRIIGCAQILPNFIALPRGCLDDLRALLNTNGIALDLADERPAAVGALWTFAGTLRPEQENARDAMLAHDFGVLNAPTAFGKTVTAAALIAARGVSTLVLVHRAQLLDQWRERLSSFLGVAASDIGLIGAGRRKPNGRLDIAVMQSLVRNGEVSDAVRQYGHIVVDECHHLSAFSFETLLRNAPARYVLGLTATPVRRDGHQPIIFMQCGPIRHTGRTSASDAATRTVEMRYAPPGVAQGPETTIQQIMSDVSRNEARNASIVEAVLEACAQRRNVLVLTERTEHVERLAAMLDNQAGDLIVLHGRLSRRERTQRLAMLDASTDSVNGPPPVVLATGRLIGEGFDHAPLDTLILAMPIAWKGTLQQYVGRLHRRAEDRREIRVIDFVDRDIPVLERMWFKRQVGYRAMGYRIIEAGVEYLPGEPMLALGGR